MLSHAIIPDSKNREDHKRNGKEALQTPWTARKKDKTGLSPKTISDVLSVLRRILNYAGTLGIFVDSKVLDIRVKQTQKSLPILSLPEQMILQQYLEEHPDALNLGILLCLLTGIRIGSCVRWRGKRSRFRKGISISVRRCNVSRIGYLGANTYRDCISQKQLR